MMILTNSLIVFLSFCAMEFAANFTHRYIMHGFMWFFHEDHHRPHKGFFEKNDIFFLIFAVPSACFIYFGLSRYFYALAAVGFGILLYGIAYFLVHEVLIHRRFTWLDKFRNPYFNSLKVAHRLHHSKSCKEGCSNFGMLVVPKK